MKWAIGDWLLAGEMIFPDEAAQLSEALRLSPAQRLQYIRVAQDVPLDRRLQGLTWSHHRAVAPLAEKDQRYWLQQALDNQWSKQELEEQIRAHKATGKQVDVKAHTRGAPQVMEEVVRAAEKVYEDAEIVDETRYAVPFQSMQALGKALGEDT
jgi:hypothetical protein